MQGLGTGKTRPGSGWRLPALAARIKMPGPSVPRWGTSIAAAMGLLRLCRGNSNRFFFSVFACLCCV